MQPCQGESVFLGKSKSTLFCLQESMHLGIIKIVCNRTAKHFVDGSFMNLGEEVILILL